MATQQRADSAMYTWIQLRSTADLTSLETHVTPEYDPARVAMRLAAAMSSAVKAVLIERSYVDKDYRSTYYNYYSKKGQRYRADCVRLHFFDDTVSFDPNAVRLRCADNRISDHYFGYMVLRPTGIATIGRSLMSPDVRSGACRYIISASHKVHLLGYRLAVEGFPSMDQHIDISVCAHVACWSILRHYSERYSLYHELLTHDITMLAQEFDPGGIVPSFGLGISHAERVFQAAGTFPVHVAREKPDDASFYRQLAAYIDSGFPLFAAMQTREHAVALVGYAWRPPSTSRTSALRYAWDELDAVAVVDDNELPYLSIPVSGGTPYSVQDVDAFIVPLPEKIYYPADAVDRLASTLFKLGSLIGLPNPDETIIRYFVTTGSAFRRFVRERESEYDQNLLETIMTLPFAQFIWIVEFATHSEWDTGLISARAVVDATASLREPVPLWLMHNRKSALVFDRARVPISDLRALSLKDVGHLGYTRMHQNLRPTQTK
jgi:hypothetical protein